MDTLIVLPCSGQKADCGTSARGPSLLDLLSPTLRGKLVKARRDVGVTAELDETRLCPARERYTGSLYEAMNNQPCAALPMLIISGGYGLVLADEPIGRYKRMLKLRDWPPGLLQECLAAAAQALKVAQVVAFCARTTDYAKLVRRSPWAKDGIDVWLVSPNAGDRGVALRLVPRACGEAVGAFLAGALDDRWVSTDGVPVRAEQVG